MRSSTRHRFSQRWASATRSTTLSGSATQRIERLSRARIRMGTRPMNATERRMPVSELTFRTVALEDPEGQWELHCGRLREKPAMSTEHNYIARGLTIDLQRQPDRNAFEVSHN